MFLITYSPVVSIIIFFFSNIYKIFMFSNMNKKIYISNTYVFVYWYDLGAPNTHITYSPRLGLTAARWTHDLKKVAGIAWMQLPKTRMVGNRLRKIFNYL